MKPTRWILALGAAALAAAALPLAPTAGTVKLAGATTVANVVVNPHRAAVERTTGHMLEIHGNASGRGILALNDGNADAAMVAEPMEIALAATEIARRKLDGSKFQFHEIRKHEIVFVVHPANPVARLSPQQLSDIHTGRITNWKQVGGRDLPITVYAEALTGGTRAMIRKSVLNGAAYSPSVRSLASVSRVAELVPFDESAIAGLGRDFVKEDGRLKVVETLRIERPLAIVTVGEPQAKVRQVIEALRAASNGSHDGEQTADRGATGARTAY